MDDKRSSARGKGAGALPRIVCIVGPTSSGKTGLGIKLANLFKGEIINSDSRQVYKELSIGTGKPVGARGTYRGNHGFIVEGVPHYLMDFLDPRDTLNVVEWREKAQKAIKGILERKHLPIVVGGTGLFIKALVDNFMFPQVAPNQTMRRALETKPISELAALLVKLDPDAVQTVDLKNPRRVIRALEVATFSGKPFSKHKQVAQPIYDVFQVGVMWPRDVLYQKVNKEVDNMIERGWIEEIRTALQKGLSEKAPGLTSIGYRELVAYLKGQKTLEQAIAASKMAVRRYAKRQETWFKRDKRIHWAKDEDEALEIVKDWLEF
ncbi:MAG: tRNA (adenosine(37)-N6)-dimethylallyltransferase MiaA [Patescibacteria group bacterium]